MLTVAWVCAPFLDAEDRPDRLPLTEEQIEAALEPFVARSKASFPRAAQRFLAAKGGSYPVDLYIGMQHEGSDGETYTLPLKVKDFTPSGLIQCEVVGGTPETSPYAEGDPLGIVEADVYDWGIRQKGKRPEGFVVRRARLALVSRVVLVLFELQADQKGRLVHIAPGRIVIPGSMEDASDLLPAEAIADGQRHLAEAFRGERVPQRFVEFPVFYTFPEGRRLNEEEAPQQ